MPLFQQIKINNHIHVVIWQITEPLQELESQVTRNTSDSEKYATLNHVEKKREFLALRCCLKHFLGHNPEVFYKTNGKPYLKDNLNISFSHTNGYAAVAFSKNLNVGVDIEHPRKNIERISAKFLRKEELAVVKDQNKMEHLLFMWGIKECVIKITGNKKLSFKNNIRIAPFPYVSNGHTSALLHTGNRYINHTFYFKKYENLFLTFGWQQSL